MEQVVENNDNHLIFVTRNTLRKKLSKILNYINSKLLNGPIEQHDLQYFFDYFPFYTKYRDIDDHNKNILSEIINGGNNLLLYCCIHKLDTVCKFIIEKYANLFDIGEKNHNYQTALIISIKNDMFDVAISIFEEDDDYDSANLGQIDKYGKTAMDYMLEKVKVDEHGIPLKENKEIVDNIEIIVDLIYFYLNETNNNVLMDRNIYLNQDNDMLHNYIDLFCDDLDFWKPLLKGYFDGDTRIQFNEKFCFNVKQAEIDTNPIIPQLRPIRSNRLGPNLPVATSNISDLPRQPRNPNQPLQIQQYQLIPKNEQIPEPLPEYDINNPGRIITYPRPPTPPPLTPPSPTPSQDNKKRARDNHLDEDEPSSKTPANNNEPDIGGNKRNKTNKKRKPKNIQKSKHKKYISKRNKKANK